MPANEPLLMHRAWLCLAHQILFRKKIKEAREKLQHVGREGEGPCCFCHEFGFDDEVPEAPPRLRSSFPGGIFECSNYSSRKGVGAS